MLKIIVLAVWDLTTSDSSDKVIRIGYLEPSLQMVSLLFPTTEIQRAVLCT